MRTAESTGIHRSGKQKQQEKPVLVNLVGTWERI
jgi:hypothetical protein